LRPTAKYNIIKKCLPGYSWFTASGKTPTIRKKTSTEGGKGKYFCGTNTNMSFVRSSVRPRG
jgi:hypothetical protein